MKNEYKRKLKVEEYVFEVDGEDIFDTELNYRFTEMEIVSYERGKSCTKIEPLIEIELEGKNKDNKEAWASFDLKTDLDYLNSLPNKKVIDITNILSKRESFLKKPNEEVSGFLNFRFRENNENDMYRLFTSLWIYKIKKNEFVLRLDVPKDLFTYFKLIFK